jgi:nicotinic acid mononucleotide adenylyltransferase
MEYLEKDHDVSKYEILIKKELEKLHLVKNNKFGNSFNTFSGNDEVCNDYVQDWHIFFNQNRWLPLFNSIRNEENESDYCLALKISDVMHKVFKNLNIIPTLCHGDANPQNFIISSDKVYFIDSGCFFGDPDYDIACYDFWNGNIRPEAHFKLYYAYILIVSNKINPSESRYKKAKRFMEEILALYPPFYPSLIFNLEKQNLYKYVIIMCGSFNPIHKNHTNNMEIARKYCQTKHLCNNSDILSVYCLAEDDRVIKKDPNSYLLYHRKEMCKLALLNVQYDYCVDSTCMFGERLISHWKNLLNNDVIIYICCGTDNIPHHVKYFDQNQLFLVNKRNRYKMTLDLTKYPNIEMMGGSEQTLSSTMIRENKHLYSDELILNYLDENVYKYIIKIKNNYIST